ncbi:amidase [Ottowia thiooxydans]|uniref:amidase n=1 Tax=Ottowia thiooxydans TaxID=219182 RepID=UPI00048A7C32
MLLAQDHAHAFMPYPAVPLTHQDHGTMAGFTFAVKDLFDVGGYPTSAGSPLMLAASGIKSRTALPVLQLLQAGARFVGKTITDELAYSLNGRNIHFGTPRNGAAPDRIPGGSSSGSASAVSHGLCDIALGTDTGGSVRAPASHCGLFGLRPTHGRISLSDCVALAPSLDTGGVFARDATHLRIASKVLLGSDPKPLKGVRLLRAVDTFALLSPSAEQALLPSVVRLQATHGPIQDVFLGEPSLDALHWAFRRIQADEAWQTHRDFLSRHRPPIESGAAERFAWGATLDAEQLSADRRLRQRFRAQLGDLLGDDGVIILPTMPDVAPLLSADGPELESYRYRAVQLLCIAGLAGFPQVTLPAGRVNGAPLGLSLMGPAGSDLGLVELVEDEGLINLL